MRFLRTHWEQLLAASLFLACIYAAVFFIAIGALAKGGFALICAYGFFQALIAFQEAADFRSACAEQGAESLDG